MNLKRIEYKKDELINIFDLNFSSFNNFISIFLLLFMIDAIKFLIKLKYFLLITIKH
jgi:hypothetical protein